LTKLDSFQNITTWIDEFHMHTPSNLPIVLVGNKSDLVNQRRVSREQATELAERLNLSYMETSALNASNVEQAFVLLITSIYQQKSPKHMELSLSTEKSPADSVPVDHSQTRPIHVAPDSTSTLNVAIRPSNNDKARSGKKSGCCVIS
jgi:Ras-related protein Rab-11A